MRHSWALIALTLNGCSLALEWDPDNLPCTPVDPVTRQRPEPACADGFSCLGDLCIRDGSTAREERCTEDRQCAPDLFCRDFQCLQSCGQAFYSETGDCRGDEFCAPFQPVANGPIEGFCLPSQCRENDDCVDGTVVRSCVPIKVGAGACLSTCELGFDPTYFDNCVVEAGAAASYCQPLGRQNPNFGAQLVCLDAGANLEGLPCNPVLNPCQEGFTCDLSTEPAVCARFCSTDNPASCGSGQVCCRKEYGQARYSVCAASCN